MPEYMQHVPLDLILQKSILGAVLPSLVVWISVVVKSKPRDLEERLFKYLLEMISCLDKLAQLFPSSETAEVKYLHSPTVVHDWYSKIAESGKNYYSRLNSSAHPYVEYTNREVNIAIPGAMCLYIYFDARSCTGNNSLMKIRKIFLFCLP